MFSIYLWISLLNERLFKLLTKYKEREIKDLITNYIRNKCKRRLNNLNEFLAKELINKNITKILLLINIIILPVFIYNFFCYYSLYGFLYKKKN